MVDTLETAAGLFEYSRDLRRDFHRHPELGFQEVRTAGVVARELGKLGLEIKTGIAETGVAALIEGSRPGKVIMLRFDMDALPITEETGTEYASQAPGRMHACGHDAHTSIGLTVARMLHDRRSEFAGTVKLVFQPAEEGLGGAERMIQEGVLEDPRPEAALGLHVWNEKPFGWVGVTSGPCMAAGEIFNIRIRGRGGHGAVPHLTADPVLAAAQVITSVQSVVSRNISPLKTAVVSICSVHGGEAFNVIPPFVDLQGTIRTFEPEVRQMVLDRFTHIVEGVSTSLGCQAEVDIRLLTPAVFNDPVISGLVERAAERVLPGLQVDTNDRTMGSEDMAYFLREIPGCFFFVGSASEEPGVSYPHHHPRFDIDERVLPRAAALMTEAALELLNA